MNPISPLVEGRREELNGLCERFNVQRLELFGSAADGSCNPETSDLDFLVEFLPLQAGEHFDAYFGLLEALQDLFQRPVDLVMTRALKNPYFLKAVNQTRMVLYSVLVTFFLGVFCGACSRTPWSIDNTRHRLEKLELDMSKSEVIEAMGKPHKREAFLAEGGETIEVLIYETEYTESGPVTDSAFTPVLLKSGRVIGWGRNMYDRTIRHHVTLDIDVDDR